VPPGLDGYRTALDARHPQFMEPEVALVTAGVSSAEISASEIQGL
jgi:hypothetical protein